MNIKDLANSVSCLPDGAIREKAADAVSKCLNEINAAQDELGHTKLWTDGSWNAKANTAGIGVMIETPDSRKLFGKTVRAKNSEEAELYAMAVGLSYLLDTFPDLKSVRLHYDCVSASVNAANIDLLADRGAPYTNLRSVMKRCRKAGVSVTFQHVKAHNDNDCNNLCDLAARYYAKVKLNPAQTRKLAPFLDMRPKKTNTAPARKEKQTNYARFAGFDDDPK